MENYLLALKESISQAPGVQDVIGRPREEMYKLLEESNKITAEFLSAFNIFYKNNKEIIDKHANTISTIFSVKADKDNLFAQKIIFALYINDSIEMMTRTMGLMGSSSDFIQLVSEYVNWENFNIHFSDFKEIQELKGTERQEHGQKLIGELFIFMKDKFKIQ